MLFKDLLILAVGAFIALFAPMPVKPLGVMALVVGAMLLSQSLHRYALRNPRNRRKNAFNPCSDV